MSITCTFTEKEFDMIALLVGRQIDNLYGKLQAAEAMLQHKSACNLIEKLMQWEEIDSQLVGWHMHAMEQKDKHEV